jgi:hypothetical protein
VCHLAPALRPGPWGQSITHIGVPSVVGQADTAQLPYLCFLTSTPARLFEKRILTNRTLRFVIVPVSYLGDFLSFLCVEAIRLCSSLCHFLVWADRSRTSAATGAGLLAARPGAPSTGVHSRLLFVVQFDRSPYLLLDPNHTESNLFAQTLRVFLTRLFRLFLCLERFRQRRQLTTDVFKKQPSLNCFGHFKLIARRWGDGNRTRVQSLGSFYSLRRSNRSIGRQPDFLSSAVK